MEDHPEQMDAGHSIEHEFFKSLLLKFAPERQEELCALLPDGEAALLSKLNTIELERYPDLIAEFKYWHPFQKELIEQKIPGYLRNSWEQLLTESTSSPPIPKFVERLLLGLLIRAGANRALFVERTRFVPLLKMNWSGLELLSELVAFRLMMRSSHFLIEKEKRQIFFEYLLNHPNRETLQSYFDYFSHFSGQLKGGIRFIWRKWRGDSDALYELAYQIGWMSLGICLRKGTHLAFLLSRRLSAKEAMIINKNTLPSSLHISLVKDIQNIVFDSFQFIQKNRLDPLLNGGQIHV
ncbi:hypothetical protein [Candidatus Similichlamydia epinepheli]|uniref:hypothetical protein n=1 Tax=Candidatus Similichlamydia epinepheli TaxID=1903953 RepID=UPI000D39D958|nr:hypothetical protein [Candidatus Similichlamydia epinepheli]